MAVRRSPGSGPKEGATSPQARAAAYGDRLSQLEKDMAEIRDGTIRKVLEKLRLLSYERSKKSTEGLVQLTIQATPLMISG